MTNKYLIVCKGGVARSQTLALATSSNLERYGIDEEVASVDFAGADVEKIKRRLRQFTDKYGCSPEEYLKQHQTLPHIKRDEEGRLYADFNIDQEQWVGAAPDYWTPLSNKGLGERAARKVRRAITLEDMTTSRMVLPVTREIRSKLLNMFGTNFEGRVKLLTEFAEIECNNPDIEDPYDLESDGVYTNLEGIRFRLEKDEREAYDLAKQTHLTAVYAIPSLFKISEKLADRILREVRSGKNER
jgi:protein-tyrosine-phosphatase